MCYSYFHISNLLSSASSSTGWLHLYSGDKVLSQYQNLDRVKVAACDLGVDACLQMWRPNT